MTVETSKGVEDVANKSDISSSEIQSKDAGKPRSTSTLLSVPPHHLVRRPSIESAFSGSDLSELSFGSIELEGAHHEGLIRTLSNASSTFVSIPPPSKWRSRLHEFWVANYGAFLVLVSQFFGCLMNIATRLLETPGSHGTPMHPFQILFVRQSITSVITCTYALWTRSVPHFPLGPPGVIRLLLVARGLFGFMGVVGMYFSLRYLPINEATILTFLAPIGACYMFSLLIPGETFSRQQQLAGFISLVGVVFIARPAPLFGHGNTNPSPPDIEVGLPSNATDAAQEQDSFHPTSAQHLQAVGLGLMGVIGAIAALTAIRAIGTRAHALLSVNYFSVWCTIASLVALLVSPDVQFRLPGNVTEWSWLFILGTSGFIMQLLLTQGMAYGGPSGTGKSQSQGPPADLEMQDRTASAAPAVANVDTLAASAVSQQPPQTKQIKGSGAKATSMLYTQMLFALISDKMIFGITPGLWSWIGSGFILFGAIWVAADGGKKSTPDTLEVPLTEQHGTPQKDLNAAHEEEVGLLADVDGADADADHIDRGLNLPTSSGSRQPGSADDR